MHMQLSYMGVHSLCTVTVQLAPMHTCNLTKDTQGGTKHMCKVKVCVLVSPVDVDSPS